MTGIRPTKLYLNKFIEYQKNKNGNDEYAYRIDQDVITKVIDKMNEVHRVGDVKGKLASDIALLEKSLIDSLHTKDGYSVYIGIPFCPSRCLYCSFTSNPIGMFEGRVETYIEAIKKELLATKELMKDHVLDTIYIGGGTPTALSSEQMDILLNNVVSILPMENVREFTVEAGRPDSITEEKLLLQSQRVESLKSMRYMRFENLHNYWK